MKRKKAAPNTPLTDDELAAMLVKRLREGPPPKAADLELARKVVKTRTKEFAALPLTTALLDALTTRLTDAARAGSAPVGVLDVARKFLKDTGTRAPAPPSAARLNAALEHKGGEFALPFPGPKSDGEKH